MNAFVSADGKTLYLQDKAIKYNDFMASMVNMQASFRNNEVFEHALPRLL